MLSLLFFVTTSNLQAAALSQSQISSIVMLLKSFGADASVTAKVQATLEGKDLKNPQDLKNLKNKFETYKREIKPVAKRIFCPNLERDLRPGSKGEEVKRLQAFLKEKGYYKYPEITGYFGKVTKKAVEEMQKNVGIAKKVPSRYLGLVGPKTRFQIKRLCGTVGPVKPPTVCTMEYAPVCGVKSLCPPGARCLAPEKMKTYSNMCMLRADGAKFLHKGECKQTSPTCPKLPEPADKKCKTPWGFEGYWKKIQLPNRCYVYRCVPEHGTNNNNISIKRFEGPVKLKVGERGTWNIVASNTLDKPLRYSIEWGDEMLVRPLAADINIKKLSPINQNSSFTHSYSTPGHYTITVKVSAEGAEPQIYRTSVMVEPAGVSVSNKLRAVPNFGLAPLNVTFTAEAIADSWKEGDRTVQVADVGYNVLYFGDGDKMKLKCENPDSMRCKVRIRHIYKKPGSYTASLYREGFYGPAPAKSKLASVNIKVMDYVLTEKKDELQAEEERQYEMDSEAEDGFCLGTDGEEYPEGTTYECGYYFKPGKKPSGYMCLQLTKTKCIDGRWKLSF